MPSCERSSTAAEYRFIPLGRAEIVPREELRQAGTLLRRHVFEVASAIDDFPEIFALHTLQGPADGQQPIRRFVLHVARDAARPFLIAAHQVVSRQLDLRFTYSEQRAFLTAHAERAIQLQEVRKHL